MKDQRQPIDVYMAIKQQQTYLRVGILAAADAVEAGRSGRAQAAPSLAPRDFADFGPLSGEGPEKPVKEHTESHRTTGEINWKA